MTSMTANRSRSTFRIVLWSIWAVGALLLLSVVPAAMYGPSVAVSALLLCLVPDALPPTSRRRDRHDLIAVASLYLGVVALMRLAFVGFTTDHIVGLFLAFASALLLGVIGPLYYTIWMRGRPMADLGLRRDNWRPTAVLALLFAGVQFALTLWGFDLPAPEDWVPLLVMALVVGVFEAIFFRGFVQNRLEAQFGPVLGIAGAAALYGLYHVGYGMGSNELVFLTGLGVVYAVAFALARNVLVLWPLLTPLGSFYNAVDTGDIDLPWASIAGFADVFALMAVALWLANRHAHKHHAATDDAGTSVTARVGSSREPSDERPYMPPTVKRATAEVRSSSELR